MLFHKLSHSSPKNTKVQKNFTHPLKWTQLAIKTIFIPGIAKKNTFMSVGRLIGCLDEKTSRPKFS